MGMSVNNDLLIVLSSRVPFTTHFYIAIIDFSTLHVQCVIRYREGKCVLQIVAPKLWKHRFSPFCAPFVTYLNTVINIDISRFIYVTLFLDFLIQKIQFGKEVLFMNLLFSNFG
ncbi:hypothetical protein ACS0PU_007110 [Formica fusca]